jgi:ApeA N-terminal domain 1
MANETLLKEWPGRWFLPDAPDVQVAGTLRMKNPLDVELELLGSFSDDLMGLFQFNDPMVVHGVAIDGPLVTAELVSEVSVGTSKFGLRKTYRVRRIIKGDLLPDLDPEVLSIEFSLSRLHDWIAPETFSISQDFQNFPTGAKYVLTYEDPPPITIFESEEFDVHIQFWSQLPFVNPRSRSECLRHFSGLRIDSHKPCKLSSLLPVVGQIRSLLSFATSTPNSVTYLAAYRKRDDSQPLQKSVFPKERLDFFPVDEPEQGVDRQLFPHEMLFTFTDESSIGGRAINSWLGNWRKLGPLIELFLGANQTSGVHQEHRFTSLIHAVEGFHRLNFPNILVPKAEHRKRVRRILDSLPEEDREFVKHSLQYSNEPSLKQRLETMLSLALETVPGFMGRESDFLKRAVATRHYLSHFEPSLRKRAAGSLELFDICRVLALLFEILTLRHLGFPPDKVREIINRSLYNRRTKGIVRFVLENRWGSV